jgi:hypothetical protein
VRKTNLIDKLPLGLAEFTRIRLRRLHDLQHRLEAIGGPEEDGELFEEVLSFETDVLNGFGLPPTEENARLLDLSGFDSVDDAVEQVLVALAQVKSQELLSRRETLADGVQRRDSPFTVLPKIGIDTHEYTLFLYDELLAGTIEVNEVLNEMDAAEPLLDDIGRTLGAADRDPRAWAELCSRLKHLKRFGDQRSRSQQ